MSDWSWAKVAKRWAVLLHIPGFAVGMAVVMVVCLIARQPIPTDLFK